MLSAVRAIPVLLSLRFHSRVSLELEVLALRHQLTVLRRQRPGRRRLFRIDRLFWVCLYRLWPAESLLKHRTQLPLAWESQHKVLGFPYPA